MTDDPLSVVHDYLERELGGGRPPTAPLDLPPLGWTDEQNDFVVHLTALAGSAIHCLGDHIGAHPVVVLRVLTSMQRVGMAEFDLSFGGEPGNGSP